MRSKSSSVSHPRKTARLGVELLEDRSVPAAGLTFDAVKGLLTIQGSEVADNVRIVPGETDVTVTLTYDEGAGPVTHEDTFSLDQLRSIVYRGGAGDDVFINDSRIPSTAFGQAGNDYLEGGLRADKLVGGEGDDTLIGFTGNDTLIGGGGHDQLFGMQGNDRLDGGAANDGLYGGIGTNSVNGGLGRNTVRRTSDGPLGPASEPFGSEKIEAYLASNGSNLSAIEQAIVDLVNAERTSRGLAPLQVNTSLVRAAQHHAANMASFNRMSHSLPGADLPEMTDRLRHYNYNYRLAGENIAWNYSSASAVMNAWMNSSGHRANILNPNFRDLGVGVRYNSSGEPYYCQVFGQQL